MATAEELLASEVCDNILSVDLDNRIIIIPKGVTNLGVESDDSVQILHFRVPRMYCSVDLSEFEIRINYENARGGGDVYEVTNAEITDDLITFDWVVGRYALTYKGNVVFNLCLKDVNENGEVVREFNTTTAALPVLPGLETGEAVIQQHSDILEQWRLDLFGVGDTVEQKIRDTGDEVMIDIVDSISQYVNDHPDELKGDSGTTFTPTVDDDGNISWTNDGGLENPETKNITGPAFTYDMFTPEQLADLTGPAGETIESIVRTDGTGAAGTTDTYTITTNLGKTYTFHVYNGADGGGAGDMLKSVYDPQNKNTDIFAYVDELKDNIGGSTGVYYGTEEPTDESHPIWINPDGESDDIVFQSELDTVVEQLNSDIDSINSELGNKASTDHTHAWDDIGGLPLATATEVGGVLADPAEMTDTQPVRIGEDGKLYTALGSNVGGGIQGAIVTAHSTDGVIYTATIDGVDSLEVGMEFMIIPDCTSTATAAWLNVNDFGNAQLSWSFNSTTRHMFNATRNDWIVANQPIKIRWTGYVWVTTDMSRIDATTIQGQISITNGGTGASTAAAARGALGITPENIGAASIDHTHDECSECTVRFESEDVTITSSDCHYVKIGRLVYVDLHIGVTISKTSDSFKMYVDDLPNASGMMTIPANVYQIESVAGQNGYVTSVLTSNGSTHRIIILNSTVNTSSYHISYSYISAE